MYEKEMVDLEELFQREQEKEKSPEGRNPETVQKIKRSLKKLDKSTTKIPAKSTVDKPKKSVRFPKRPIRYDVLITFSHRLTRFLRQDSKRRSRNESPSKRRVKEEKRVKEDKEPAKSPKEQRVSFSDASTKAMKPICS